MSLQFTYAAGPSLFAPKPHAIAPPLLHASPRDSSRSLANLEFDPIQIAFAELSDERFGERVAFEKLDALINALRAVDDNDAWRIL
jgi:hypothetical protein